MMYLKNFKETYLRNWRDVTFSGWDRPRETQKEFVFAL